MPELVSGSAQTTSKATSATPYLSNSLSISRAITLRLQGQRPISPQAFLVDVQDDDAPDSPPGMVSCSRAS